MPTLLSQPELANNRHTPLCKSPKNTSRSRHYVRAYSLSVRGCWGQPMLLFWKPRMHTKNLLSQHSKTTFKQDFTCIFLSVRVNLNETFQSLYSIVDNRSTSQLVTPHVTNSISNMGCQKLEIVWSLRYSGLINTSCVCQVSFFSAHLDNKQKSFVPKKKLRHVTIRDFKNQKISFSE